MNAFVRAERRRSGLNTAAYVQQYTAGEGFDIVHDTVGGSTLDASFLAVKPYQVGEGRGTGKTVIRLSSD